MEQVLMEFKKNVEDYANELLGQLDTKIGRLEKKLTGMDLQEQAFHFKRRISKLEINKFGCSLSTHNNGDN